MIDRLSQIKRGGNAIVNQKDEDESEEKAT
jgi:hypothetical protein